MGSFRQETGNSGQTPSSTRPAISTEILLFAGILVTLPLWGYTPVQFSGRGVRIDWLLIWLLVGTNGSLLLAYRRRIYWRESVFVLLLFNVAVLLSAAVPLSKGGASLFDFTTTFVQFQTGVLLFFVMTQIVVHHARLRSLLRVYLVVGMGVALFGVIQFGASMAGMDLTLEFANPSRADPHSGYTEVLLGYRRSTSFFSEPRQFGGFLVTRLCLVVGLLSYGRYTVMSRRSLVIGGLVLAGGLVSALSVSALVAAALGLLLTLTLVSARGRGSGILTLNNVFATIRSSLWLILILCGGGLLVLSVAPAREWILGRITQLLELRSLLGALASPEAGSHGALAYVSGAGYALSVLGEHLVTGVGLNNLHFFRPPWMSGAHGLFGFAAEVGLVGMFGLALFFLFFANEFRETLRNRMGVTDGAMTSAAIVLFVVPFVVTFATGLYSPKSTFFWVDVSLACLLLSSLRYSRFISPAVIVK